MFCCKKNSYLIQEHHRQPPYNDSLKHPRPQSRHSSKWQ